MMKNKQLLASRNKLSTYYYAGRSLSLASNALSRFAINILTFALAFAATLSYAQTASQMSQAQAALAAQGRSVSDLSPAEIAAAKDVLKKQQVQERQFRSLDSVALKTDSISIRNQELADSSAFQNEHIGKKFTRYENIVFSQSLPSAFYEVQGMVPADYPLKSGDNLELSLWGAVERQFTLAVNNQGNVFVEGAGLVNVANLTLGEAEKLITKKLQTVYSGITSGRISVNLRTTKLSPTKVFIMGAVSRPGGYDLPGNANVFLALYRAGGPTEIGSIRNIKIRRASGDSAVIDLYDFLLKGQKVGEGLLRDGDLVFVPKAEKLAKASGAIGTPAIYELKAGETLSDLLSFAGGLFPNTDHTITLWRIDSIDGAPKVLDAGKAREIANDSAFQIQNGDSIFVFASTRPNSNAIQVRGSVFYPGFYVWKDGMGVSDAVNLSGGVLPEAFTQRIIVERLNPDSSFSYFSDDLHGTLGFELKANDNVVVLDSRALRSWRFVNVAGYVKKPRAFEWQDSLNALDLIAMCGGFLPNANKEEIIIERLIDGKFEVENVKLPIKDELSISNQKIFVKEGDRIVVTIDTSYYEQEVVALSGAFKNSGFYALAKHGETLKEFMNRVAKIDEEAYIAGGQLFRRELNTDITITTTARSFYRVNLDFEKVLNGKEKDIVLQGKDSIYIPFELLTVNVTGEVISPGHVLWQKGWDIDDYLDAAGGLTINGDEDRVVLMYANGQRVKQGEENRNPDSGSEIFVSYKPAPEPIKLVEIISAAGSIATAITAIIALVLVLN